VASDLTIVYLTANRMPQTWVDFHLKYLRLAVGDFPLITVSSKPMDLGMGETKLIQDIPWGRWSTFCMWNRAAKVAQTEFVAIAEDDTLYHPWHFTEFRPKADEIAYDMSRWTVMSWHLEPRYSLIRRLGGFMMIAPRKLMIEALDEREAKYPNGHYRPGEIGRPDSDQRMQVTPRKAVEWWCKFPSINLAHPAGASPTYIGPTGVKRKEGELKAYDIPYWGKAAGIAEAFNCGLSEDSEWRQLTKY
jgi:hypothetical protein